MSALAKITKHAAQLEHDRQYDKALALYARLLDEPGAADEEVDVPLYNRAGDVALRAGQVDRAVAYYERALDLYAAGGFLNNAIALGTKILRHAPERAAAHYTLGVLHARQGFRPDARQHFLEYADRMHRGGRDDEAARAIAELLLVCASGAEARDALAQHVARSPARAPEVAARLGALVEAALASGAPGLAAAEPPVRGAEVGAEHGLPAEPIGTPVAGGAAEVPGFQPTALGEVALPSPGTADLVFLDVEFEGADDLVPAAQQSAGPVGPPSTVAPIADAGWSDAAGIELVADGDAMPSWSTSGAGGGLDLLDLGELPGAGWDGGSGRTAPDAPALAPLATVLAELPGELPPLGASMLALAGEGWTAPDVTDGAGVLVLAPPALRDDAPDILAEFDLGGLPRLEGDAAADAADAPGSLATPGGLDDAFELPVVELATEASVGEDTGSSADALDDLVFVVPPAAPAPERAPRRASEAPIAGAGFDDAGDPEGGLDLGAWLRASEPPRSTRLVAPVLAPTGDEEADFRATLAAFKAGVADHLDVEDHDSRYDLGVAYREMGLLEEAIGEFQKAARAPGRPLRALEALAQCFLDRDEPELALSALAGVAGDVAAPAAAAPAGIADERLVGVCYLLGLASERVGRAEDARRWYLRVLATDYQFRDAAHRLASLQTPRR